MPTCYRCADGDHLHCLNRVSLERVCNCDSCAQVREDALQDQLANLERNADADERD